MRKLVTVLCLVMSMLMVSCTDSGVSDGVKSSILGRVLMGSKVKLPAKAGKEDVALYQEIEGVVSVNVESQTKNEDGTVTVKGTVTSSDEGKLAAVWQELMSQVLADQLVGGAKKQTEDEKVNSVKTKVQRAIASVEGKDTGGRKAKPLSVGFTATVGFGSDGSEEVTKVKVHK